MTVIRRERPIHTICGFPAAILDFRVKEASEEDGKGAVEQLAPENMGVGAEILFLSSTELEKPWGVILPPRWLQTGVKK